MLQKPETPPNRVGLFREQLMGLQVKDRARIRRLFAEISPRYDLLNHLLSANRDRSWRRRVVAELSLPPGGRVLDICTGTGDLALEIAARVQGRVIGTDFTPEMVRRGEEKRRRRRTRNLTFLIADSLRLPFPDATFDVVTVAFGIRNVCDLAAGLNEMLRVLRPGGEAAILEFSSPRDGWFGRVFRLYFRHVLPRLGGWISGVAAGGEAYSYLPASVGEWPSPAEFSRQLELSGFTGVRFVPLTLGVSVLHLAARPRIEAASVAGVHHEPAL